MMVGWLLVCVIGIVGACFLWGFIVVRWEQRKRDIKTKGMNYGVPDRVEYMSVLLLPFLE